MANGNGKLLTRIVGVLSTLLTAAIIGGVIMYRDVGVAQDNIETIQERQEATEEAVRELPVIQNDIEHIKDAVLSISKSIEKIEGKSHKHNPR